jgi:DNA-binding transcriptional ArsR family regulator
MDVLDEKGIKALADPTRRKIIKTLGERRKTQAEIAKELGIKPPTVSSHLKKLADAKIVKKEPQDGRKWVYYSLTPRGTGVAKPQTNYAFTLSIGIGVLLILAVGYLGFTAWASPGSEFDGLAKSGSSSDAQAREIAPAPIASGAANVLTGRLQLFQAPYAIGGEADPSGMILTEADNTTYYRELAGKSEGGRVYVKGVPDEYAGLKVSITAAGYELVTVGGVETPKRTFVVVNASSAEPLEPVPSVTSGQVKEMDVGGSCG